MRNNPWIMPHKKAKRRLVDITFDEAVEIVKLAEVFPGEWRAGLKEELKLERRKGGFSGEYPFAQLTYNPEGHSSKVVVNFSDDKNAVSLYMGNRYYRTFYRIIRYLEQRGFDLKRADTLQAG